MPRGLGCPEIWNGRALLVWGLGVARAEIHGVRAPTVAGFRVTRASGCPVIRGGRALIVRGFGIRRDLGCPGIQGGRALMAQRFGMPRAFGCPELWGGRVAGATQEEKDGAGAQTSTTRRQGAMGLPGTKRGPPPTALGKALGQTPGSPVTGWEGERSRRCESAVPHTHPAPMEAAAAAAVWVWEVTELPGRLSAGTGISELSARARGKRAEKSRVKAGGCAKGLMRRFPYGEGGRKKKKRKKRNQNKATLPRVGTAAVGRTAPRRLQSHLPPAQHRPLV